MTFINGYCAVRNNQIVKDHQLIYKSAGADLPTFLNGAYSFLKTEYPKFYKMNPLSQLGILAAEVLLKGRILAKEYPSDQIGVVLSNASSSLDTDIDYFETLKEIPSPSLFVYTLPNIVAGEICIRHQFKGENAFLVFEKFDAPFLSFYVDRLLGNDSAQTFLAGWVEVLGGHYDVFLYLVEKQKGALGIKHTAENLIKLYISE